MTVSTPASSVLLRRLGAERRAHIPARTFQLLSRPGNRPLQLRATTLSARCLSTDEQHAPPNKVRHTHGSSDMSRIARAVKVNMRTVKSSISIITSCNPSIAPGHERESWKGATVASFNTVSMHPQPLVSFNIHQRSSTLEAIRKSGYFAVNVLSRSPHAAYLADLFARPNDDEESPAFVVAEKTIESSFYAGKMWFMTPQKIEKSKSDLQLLPPRLQVIGDKTQPRAVLFSLLCYTGSSGMSCVPAGDHVIVVGRVVHVLSAKGTKPFLPTDGSSVVVHAADGADNESEEVSQYIDNLTYQNGKYSTDPDHTRPRRFSRGPFTTGRRRGGRKSDAWRAIDLSTPSETDTPDNIVDSDALQVELEAQTNNTLAEKRES